MGWYQLAPITTFGQLNQKDSGDTKTGQINKGSYTSEQQYPVPERIADGQIWVPMSTTLWHHRIVLIAQWHLPELFNIT